MYTVCFLCLRRGGGGGGCNQRVAMAWKTGPTRRPAQLSWRRIASSCDLYSDGWSVPPALVRAAKMLRAFGNFIVFARQAVCQPLKVAAPPGQSWALTRVKLSDSQHNQQPTPDNRQPSSRNH